MRHCKNLEFIKPVSNYWRMYGLQKDAQPSEH